MNFSMPNSRGNSNGFSLDAETDKHRMKYIFLALGLLLAALHLDGNVSQELVLLIMTVCS